MKEDKILHIMVSDANHHVRNLLKRELENEGYEVYCLRSGIEVINYIHDPGLLDLVILDPELLYPYGRTLSDELNRQSVTVPILIHAYRDSLHGVKIRGNVHFVEKGASSIGVLKSRIRKIVGQIA